MKVHAIQSDVCLSVSEDRKSYRICCFYDFALDVMIFDKDVQPVSRLDGHSSKPNNRTVAEILSLYADWRLCQQILQVCMWNEWHEAFAKAS